MDFSELGLSKELLQAISDAGYTQPTPIQEQAIPYVLMGRDVLGCAQTGTGKTASFTLPMIEILAAGRARARMPRSLILEPTRELAAQVAENFETYGRHHRLSKALLIGGESMAEQVKVLDRGVDVLIATPGRLMDVFDRGWLLLNNVRVLVIDESDRMLDMGFIPDVERIVSLLSRMRQTLLFSATMPPEIRRLADAFLMNPKEITVAPPATPAATVEQTLVQVGDQGAPDANAGNSRRGRGRGRGDRSAGGRGDRARVESGTLQKLKREALRRLIDREAVRNALVFCNRKRDVGVVHRSLVRHGYDAGLLHGDMPQSARSEVLDKFKRGEMRLLVCSDVAARGLDIQDMSHVFNFDTPTHAEDYVHRIGRTGRAGRSGRALTLVTAADAKYVAAISRLVGKDLPKITLDEVMSGTSGNGADATDSGPPPVESVAPPATRDQSTRGTSTDDRGPASRAESGDKGGRGKKRRAKGETRKPARPESKDAPPRRRSREKPDSEGRVVSLGDHVPEFLRRDPMAARKE